MSGRLERQRWLGALALAVAVPLPLTGIVTWPFLVPFVAVGALLLVARRPLSTLPAWAENLLAPVILVLVVTAGGLRFGVLRPVAQLAVLVAAVRLLGSHEPKRAPMALGLLGLVGVAGVASSTHPTLVLYLLGLLALTLAAVTRLQVMALAERAGARPSSSPWPSARVVGVSMVIAVLVAAPLFALLPRLRSPFAVAPGGGRAVSGFREGVVLSSLGAIKASQAPVMTLRFSERVDVEPDWLRLVGATLQHYRGGLWARGRRNAERLTSGAGGRVELATVAAGAPRQRVDIELDKEGEVLFVPPGTVTIELPEGVPVRRDPMGVLRIPRGSRLPLRYSAEFVPGAVVQTPPEAEDLRLPADPEAIVRLAREYTAGARSARAAATSIEARLRADYAYTLNLPLGGPLREDPVNWFLFRGREGHCEFFASAMVLLARAVGVPARLQAGYAGGEPLGGNEFLVRESNAHAWVVAFTGRSWEVFDPTPAEGRPGLAEQLAALPWRMRWERVEGLWDRWVLTFSLADQVELAGGVVSFARQHGARVAGAAAALAAVLSLLWMVRRRRLRRRVTGAGDAPGLSRVLGRLAALARRAGLLGEREPTPREVAAAVASAFPEVAAEVRALVGWHERWRYAGGIPPTRREVTATARAVTRAFSRRRR